MKILLLPSYLGAGRYEPVFPLGLAYIASMLAEHELLCWDPNVVDGPMTELARILDRFEPDLVGLSLRNIDSVLSSLRRPPISYYEHFVSTVKMIKGKAPSAKIIVGGTGFSIFAEAIMRRNREIDFGVVSEGERAMPQLVENLHDPGSVRNILMTKDDGVIFTGADKTLDFDALPAPSWDRFDVAKYRKIRFSMGIQSKRGCSFRCLYCVNPRFIGTRVRLKSPEKVVNEIEELATQHNIRSFYFADPVFNFPPDHAREICREILRRGLEIEWRADFRPDFLNARLMMEAVKAGCECFCFSPDGGSEDAMKVLGKGMDVTSVINTAKWIGQIENAKGSYSFVYDLPKSNLKHLYGLAQLTKTISLLGRRKVTFSFSRMRIYPHTPLHRIALNQKRISPVDDLLMPVYYGRCSQKLADVPGSILAGYSLILRKLMSENEVLFGDGQFT
jgi:anaerobic magnesium-protoporphyrin IX monomethyl ester cyclase